MARPVKRQEHTLSMRLPEADIDLIDRAATLRGRSRTDFVRDAAMRAAEEALLEAIPICMSAAGFAAFTAAVSGPGTPVPEMVNLFRRVIKGPNELLGQVSSLDDLIEFIKALRKELMETPESWENLTLSDYLEAMSAWLFDAKKNEGTIAHVALDEGAALCDSPSWRTFARILAAATVYE